MKLFCESATSSRTGLQELRDVNIKILNNPFLKNQNPTCDDCKFDRMKLRKPLIVTAVSMCANNMTMILNRIEGAKKDSLRIVKTLKK